MGFIGLAIALPPPSVHEVSQSPLLIQIQIQIHIYSFDRCPNQMKFSCQKDASRMIAKNPGAVGDRHVCHPTFLRLQNCPL